MIRWISLMSSTAFITPAAGDELGPGFEYGGSNYTRTYPSGEDSEEWIENIIRPVLQVNPNEDAVIYMTEEVTPAAASTGRCWPIC